MKIILDTETTRQKNPITGKDDPSPYNPLNRLVSVQVKNVDTGAKFFYPVFHSEQDPNKIEYARIQRWLDEADLLIGHNLKFDLQWLLAAGFKYEGKLHDTQIFEYVYNRGRKSSLRLADLAEKLGLPPKLDILEEYWKQGINTDCIPLAELMEYGLQDLDTTDALYHSQRNRYSNDDAVRFLWKSIELTNEALYPIVEMERNGCAIDKEALADVEREYVTELQELERGIRLKISDLMGDTPINLDSPDDMSKLLYGFEVKDKKLWAQTLGIGSSERNSVKKKKIPRLLPESRLRAIIKAQTTPLYKTEAQHCNECHGKGKIRRIKKDGSEWKKETICKNCDGVGFLYISSKSRAGLRLHPINSQFATAAGFAADKKVIERYLQNDGLDEEVKAFLRALARHSAITSYLSTFVEGIRNNTREDGLLHTSLNQCVTATGRLSSSNPNFQNLPRGNTFPVRKAIKSRFEGGSILEVDFAGLEYRVAVMLAECPVGLQSITSGKDRHQVSAEIIFGVSKEQCDPVEWKTFRQNAKAHTFKPLYGGESGTEAEQKYYKAFLEEHTGIAEWHERLCDEAVATGEVRTPFHRIFSFPNARRNSKGRVVGKTQIVNYPVQSAATADIIWLVICDIYKEMKKAQVKSKLILQVHDAVVLDIHPAELNLMIKIVKNSFDKVWELMYTRYGYKTEVPIDSEMSVGPNWKDKKEIKLNELV